MRTYLGDTAVEGSGCRSEYGGVHVAPTVPPYAHGLREARRGVSPGSRADATAAATLRHEERERYYLPCRMHRTIWRSLAGTRMGVCAHAARGRRSRKA
eukprot:5352585-Prymnesium_polylepis.2